ncbi:MAG: hypothetical protein Kow00107_08420 [Planctomycetota bacterium]
MPKLSAAMIDEKVNKIGFNLFPDILPSQTKCKEVLSMLYDKHPDYFQGISEVGPNVFALTRAREGGAPPEHTLVITPKGGTLTYSDQDFQRDDFMKSVTCSTLDALRAAFPIRRIPRVGRIVETVLAWPEYDLQPNEWIRDNFTVFRADVDDVHEVSFKFLYRSNGMNINTIVNPVRHRKRDAWGLQIICDINNIDTSGNVTNEMVTSLIDFSTLYFPDRTFEFLNEHVSEL